MEFYRGNNYRVPRGRRWEFPFGQAVQATVGDTPARFKIISSRNPHAANHRRTKGRFYGFPFGQSFQEKYPAYAFPTSRRKYPTIRKRGACFFVPVPRRVYPPQGARAARRPAGLRRARGATFYTPYAVPVTGAADIVQDTATQITFGTTNVSISAPAAIIPDVPVILFGTTNVTITAPSLIDGTSQVLFGNSATIKAPAAIVTDVPVILFNTFADITFPGGIVPKTQFVNAHTIARPQDST